MANRRPKTVSEISAFPTSISFFFSKDFVLISTHRVSVAQIYQSCTNFLPAKLHSCAKITTKLHMLVFSPESAFRILRRMVVSFDHEHEPAPTAPSFIPSCTAPLPGKTNALTVSRQCRATEELLSGRYHSQSTNGTRAHPIRSRSPEDTRVGHSVHRSCVLCSCFGSCMSVCLCFCARCSVLVFVLSCQFF